MARGQERFDIFCAPCHGRTGQGDGMVVRRGYRRPPSIHQDRLRDAPAGHFFDVITNGFGAMPDYAAQIKARGPLGDCRLRPRAPAERARDAGRRPGGGAGPDPAMTPLTQTADVAHPGAGRAAAPPAARRRCRRCRVARRSLPEPAAVLPVVPDGLHALPGRHARLPGARHGPPALGRRVGRRHPAADRRGGARAAGDDGDVPADRARHAAALRLDQPGSPRCTTRCCSTSTST